MREKKKVKTSNENVQRNENGKHEKRRKPTTM